MPKYEGNGNAFHGYASFVSVKIESKDNNSVFKESHMKCSRECSCVCEWTLYKTLAAKQECL